jgi:hypothetical protein
MSKRNDAMPVVQLQLSRQEGDTRHITSVDEALRLLENNSDVPAHVVESMRKLIGSKDKPTASKGTESATDRSFSVRSNSTHQSPDSCGDKVNMPSPASQAPESGRVKKKKLAASKKQLQPEVVLEIYRKRPRFSHQESFRRGNLLLCKSVAPKYGVTPKTIRDIWRGRTWSQVTMSEWTHEERIHHAQQRDDMSDAESPDEVRYAGSTAPSRTTSADPILQPRSHSAHPPAIIDDAPRRLHATSAGLQLACVAAPPDRL